MEGILKISRRFCGPPESANGGYVCGLLANFLGGSDVEVTLRSPPPLEEALRVQQEEGGKVRLLHEGNTVAEARFCRVELQVPEPIDFDQAGKASQAYVGFQSHPFPTCFVCGPDRSAGDALRIFAGPWNGPGRVAAPWEPHVSLADPQGRIRKEFLWAALDCPGYFAVAGDDCSKAVLGRMAVSLRGEVRRGEKYVVLGWPLGREGRKLYSGTALYNQAGDLIGKSKAIWIRIE